jgi:hypothetical protein
MVARGPGSDGRLYGHQQEWDVEQIGHGDYQQNVHHGGFHHDF